MRDATNQPGDRARLLSLKRTPPLDGQAECLGFWYHMDADNVGSLNIYMQWMDNGTRFITEEPLWSSTGNRGDYWWFAGATFMNSLPYQAVIEGTMGSGTSGGITIDDVGFIPGPCDPKGHCSFDRDMCSWRIAADDGDDEEPWYRTSGSTDSSGTGPTNDHTKGTSEGYYMHVDGTYMFPWTPATMYSEVFDPTSSGGDCFSFWYHAVNPTGTFLNFTVYYRQFNPPATYDLQVKFSLDHDRDDLWYYGQFDIDSVTAFQILFQVVGSYADIAVDDTSITTSRCEEPNPWHCTFEDGLCGYTQASDDQTDWKHYSGSTSSSQTGPSFDHTTGTEEGYYMYLESSTGATGDKARLLSPLAPPGKYCISFWFHMFGQTINTLNVYIQRNNTALELPVWTRTGSSGNQWIEGYVDVVDIYEFMVVYEAVRGSSYTGDIAIDDVDMTEGECTGSHTCDFQHDDLCGYQQELSADDFDWLQGMGSTSSSGTGPTTDHTYGTAYGKYMYIDSSEQSPGDKAQLYAKISDPDPSGVTCWKFYYNMNGAGIDTLTILYDVDGTQNVVLSISGNRGDKWFGTQAEVATSQRYRLVFEASVGDRMDTGDIAIDDVDFRSGSCGHDLSCDFEADTCLWENEPYRDDADWIRYSGSTVSDNTGPNVDHTIGTALGYYMYLESNTLSPGYSAWLISPAFTLDLSFQCFTFWYHMYGSTIGELNLLIVNDVTLEETYRWRLNGQQSPDQNTWLQGKFGTSDLYEDMTYVIKIEAVLGHFNYGDIAVDDLNVETGTCSVYPEAAEPSLQETVTCDFEINRCGWFDMQDDRLDWIRYRGQTPTAGTGPYKDHTTGNGFHLYFEATQGSTGYNAKVISPPISATPNGACFSFWLYMFGQTMGELELSSVSTDGQQTESLWKQEGTLKNQWVYRHVELSNDYDYQLIFNAVRGSSEYSDIAIDDLLFDPSSGCPELEECSFETDYCGWSQETVQDDFDWSRSRGKDHSSIPTDKTTGTNTGYYAWLDTTSNPIDGQTAILFSPTYTLTSIPHCLRFYYYHDGVGALTVHSRQSGSYSDPLWEAPPTGVTSWRFGSSTVTGVHSFQAAFKGTVGSTPDSLMAIDEVRIDVGACPSLGYCTFEEPMCDWTNVHYDDFDWLVHSGSTPSSGTGPTSDHTLGTPQGHYIYIESSNSHSKYDAILESVDFPPRVEGCFSFWYHMYGDELGTLNVHLQELQSGKREVIWTKEGDQGNAWILAEVDTTPGVYHMMMFQAVDHADTGSYTGDIALDDIQYTEHNCKYVAPPTSAPTLPPITITPLPWDCTFEDGTLCSWTQGTTDDFDWTIQNGSTPTVGTGPPADHTSQTKYGKYIVIDASSTNADDVARLYSDVIPEGYQMCLTFWYHMYGAHVGSLNVGYGNTDNNTEGSVIWTKSGTQSYSWLWGRVAIITTADNPKVYLEGTAADSYQGDIAIDDIIVVYGDCPAVLFCDFQADDACGYVNSDNDELDWNRDRGLSSVSTGPQLDHTSGTADGFYMRIRTGQRPRNGDSGRLFSPAYPIPLNGYRCAEFWYMISEEFGEFAIEAVYLDSSGIIIPSGIRATFTEPTSGFWRKASLEVPSEIYGTMFLFDLEVTEAISSAFVALDDIYMRGSRCIGQPGSCDFEVDTCDWTNTQNADEIDWLRHSGSTGNQDTGPDFDHTTGSPSGWYMYMDSALGAYGTRARLESSSIDPPEDFACFSLWYHMTCSDDSKNTLTVAWETVLMTKVIWSFTGVKENEWSYQQISFVVTDQYRMMVEGILADEGACDIAIDDLYLFNGACSADTTPAPPFNCSDGSGLVDASKICDMRDDCTDGSDEINCGICSFEDDQCGYISDPAGLLPWIRQGGGVSTTPPPNLLLPPTDFAGASGTYMIVDNTADPVEGGDYARLVGPWMQETGSSCVMQFWYYLSGADDIIVSYKTSPIEETFMYRAATPRSGSWQQGIFTVGRIRNPFQINFLGQPDLSADGGVTAVSDIQLSNCGFREPETSCNVGEFTCSNRACVDTDRVCNFADDCGDYSDEIVCDPDRYSGRCDFESNLCSYFHLPGDYLWVRTSGALTRETEYAPTRDHTSNSAAGHYMLADAIGTSPGDVARIASPTFQATGLASTCEIRLYFFGHGSDAGIINIYTRTSVGGPLELERTLSNFAIDSFAYYDEDLIVLDNFQVVIEAVAGSGPNGAIAIDDISFMNCDLSNDPLPVGSTLAPPTTLPPCPVASDYQCGDGQCIPNDQVCDFITQCDNGRDEQFCGACEFDNRETCGSENFGWRLREAGSDPDYLPTDHFNNASAPGFYLESIYGYNTLTTPAVGPTGPACQVEFYYYMSTSSSQLELRVRVEDDAQLFVVRGSENPGTWEYGVAYVGVFEEKIRLSFDHTYLFPVENPSDFTMALDGIDYLQCVGNSSVSPDISCTFEEGLCGYIQGTSPDEDDFDWLRARGETASTHTGPRFDHTTGSGYYMYIEADGPSDGQRAILQSHPQRATNGDGVCLTWYYHMYGPDVDMFNVYIVQGSQTTPIFKRQGTQGNQWKYAQWTVTSSIAWGVMFEAFRGKGSAGDIAIDDVIVLDGACSTQRTCDFEVGYCSWTQESKDNFDWSTGNNGSPVEGTGPPTDHTMGTDLGMFAYVHTAKPPRKAGEVAQLKSPIYPATASECLTFWYHIYGIDIGKLEILIYDTVSLQSTSVWQQTGHDEMEWHYGRASITPSHSYQIVISATLWDADIGDIAIDDLAILDESCSRPGFCDFEQDKCGWSEEKETDTRDWLRNNGATPSPFTGPSFDHTTGTDQGMYMYFEADDDLSDSWADLVSEYLPQTTASCVTFWYHMYGSAIGSLEVYLMDTDKTRTGPMWSKAGSQGDSWILGSVDIAFNSEFQVIFEATGTNGAEGDIALDDIDIQDGSCSDGGGPTSIPIVSMSCTFESSLCSYTQSKNDQFDWTRNTWFMDPTNNAPTFDHTVGDKYGWYVFIEANNQSPGDMAQLAGPTQNPTGQGSPKCLVFWYHMYGASVNRLNVYLRLFQSQSNQDSIIFTKYGSQGNQWIKGEKEVLTDDNWAIIYEGVIGSNYIGDIAIDDISLYDGVCPTQVECDFEVDFCSWTQDPTNSWQWLRNAGSTPTANTGPSYDHSTGSALGYYAYAKASDASAGSKARLFSPIYLDTDLECLRFWYHMYGANIGQLTVYTENQVTQSNSDPLFTSTGPSSDAWRFGQVSISSSHRYKAVIEATRGDGVQGDIAIDDVEIIRGSCPPPGYCDFQSDLCGWSQEATNDDWDWLRTSGSTDSATTGPPVDHTTGTGDGFYIYFENSYVTLLSVASQTAVLNSEDFPAADSACLSLWYHMYGQDVGDLYVYLLDTSGQVIKTLWSRSGDLGNAWFNDKIDIMQDEEFRIQLSAVGNKEGTEGDIAIDDLDYEMMACSDIGSPAPVTTSRPTAAPVLSICTFETGYCDFTPTPSGSLAWSRGFGSRYANTGPTVDHTLGSTSGYYVYLMTDVGNSGDYALLTSASMTAGSQGICASWWYHMNGADINKLEVWKDGSSNVMEWIRTGHQGPDWKQGQVYLTGSFTVKFQGYRGSGTRGAIALDDISFSSGICPSQTMCDFEHGDWCGFDQDYTDQGDWNVQPDDFSALALAFGPDADHTYGTSLGHFIYVDSSVNTNMGKVRLISPVYPSTFQRCLQIWFFINGNDPPQLTATVTIGDTPYTQILALDSSAVDNMWMVYEASFSSSLEYTIVFEATIGSDGVLALDDINLNKDYCAPPGSCDFEYDTCTFWNDPYKDDFDWLRSNGATPSLTSGPITDHSTGTPAGFYVYIDSASPRQLGDIATLYSPVVEDVKCVSFWYYMGGADQGRIDVVTDQVMWTQTGPLDNVWLHGTLTTRADDPTYSIGFRGSIGTPSESDVAIDDISIYDGACASATETPPCQFYCDNGGCLNDATLVCNFKDDCGDSSDETNCGSCTFESGWCNYTDTSIGSMVWQRGNGATPNSNTGPSKDNTLGTAEGYYLYIDASQGSSYSEASLMSPDLNEASPSCILEVWVHMYGTDIGSLGIYIVSGLEKALLAWNEESQRDEWIRWSIGIGRIRGTFQIQYLAQRSFDVIGDIAIDDITFRDCGFTDPPPDGCDSDDYTCLNGNCIETDRLCDLTDDCGDMSDEMACVTYEQCSFENGICSWSQLNTDELDWRHYSGITRTPWTGPARDHTTGLAAGFYIYLEASDGNLGDRARLASRTIISVSSEGCFLRFYYHMYGQDINELNVYTRDSINGPLTRIWSRQGNIGDYYIRADIELENPANPIQVIIEATCGDGIYGDIAIDDTSFTSGCVFSDTSLPSVTTKAPTAPPTLPACPQDSYQCDDGTCLSIEQRCDGTTDCNGTEDEINCGDCTFENDTCGWSSIPNGAYLWTRIQASDVPVGRGPANDHTLDSPSGYYMFVDSTYGTFGMTALLISPTVLGAAGASCELEFYYHMLGGPVGSLSVILYDNNLPDTSLILTGDQGSTWQRGSLMLGPRYPGQYYVRFEASPGLGFDDTSIPTDIAVDDIRFINCGKSADLNCNFGVSTSEGTFCGWIQANGSDTFNWALNKGATSSGYTGPQFDHTDGLSYYAYMEASSPAVRGDFARLDSGALRSTQNQPYCFSFWYHMYGSSVGTLRVIQRDADGQNEVIVWSRLGNQGSEWFPGQKNIITSSNYELILEATRAANYYGDIAVDDTALTAGACPGSINCDFELGLCDWKNLDNDIDDFDWIWGTPSSSQGAGPPVDHSTFTNSGHYLYIDTGKTILGDSAVLQSHDYSHTGPRCVEFYYHMSGPNPGTLSVYRQDDGDVFVSPTWSKEGDQGDRWMLAPVEIIPNPDKSYKIYIEAKSAGASSESDLAIDDINIDDRLCLPEGACTFEYDMCGYVNDYENDDNFDWLRGYRTSSGYTGPPIDHTLQTIYGHYVYIEASNRAEGSRAWLLSEHFAPTAGRCMEFWYHMYGGGMGDLNVYLTTASTEPRLLFTRSGNHGEVWLQGKVDVDATENFWVTFEAVVGYNYTSDVALDDMFLHESICAITVAPPTLRPPPATYPPDSHNCDFEADFCTWTQDDDNDFDWIRASGATDSAGTGPSSDHTIGDQTGYYIYIETSDGSPDDIARLNSELLINVDDTGYCMEFWFQMYGEHLGALTVYEKIGDDEVAVWQETNPRGPQWNQVHLHFTDTGTYMVIFEGVHGPNVLGDIALDDISFHPGTCPTPSMCDFENGACYFSQSQDDQFDWEVIQANSRSVAPVIDHTYGTAYGHIFFADMTALTSDKDVGIVETGPLPPTQPDGQCLQVWYSMFNSKYCQLQVYKVHLVTDDAELLWEMDGIAHEDEWHVMEINLNNTDNLYEIRFQASTRDYSQNSAISLDDLFISQYPCSPYGDCNFETSFCTWKNEETADDFDWQRIQGRTPSDGTGPGVDHTFGTPYGTYIYTEATGKAAGQSAILKSGDFLASQRQCLEFYYHMYGEDVGDLFVLSQANTESKVSIVKTIEGNKGDAWRQQMVQLEVIEGAYSYQLSFQAKIGSSHSSDISLDDITFYDGECPDPPSDCDFLCGDDEQTCIPYIKFCDFTPQCPNSMDELDCGSACTFEQDTCRWWNYGSSAYGWIRHQGSTPDSNTGPAYDHTTLSAAGWYMYVGTTPSSGTAFAVFSSRMHNNAAATCEIRFWYHMYGEDIGTLQLFIQEEVFLMLPWFKSGDQGDYWHEGIAGIGRIPGGFNVKFQSVRTFEILGDVAIDDIRMESCALPVPQTQPCDDDEFRCDRDACISTRRLCDFTDDCGDLSDEASDICQDYDNCDFEDDTCDWSQDTLDEIEFKRMDGPSDEDSRTGPYRDHTTQYIGYYMVMDASTNGYNEGDRARLISHVYRSNGPECRFRLWYHMFGSNMGTLNIFMRTSIGGYMTTLFTKTGHSNDYWELADVDLPGSGSPNFQIVIEAVRGDGPYGDIGIDDTSFTPDCLQASGGLLPGSTTPAATTIGPCGVGKWQCADETCIDSDLYCDYQQDCPDNSDEALCGPCEFDTDLCGWRDESFGRYVWAQEAGDTSTIPALGQSIQAGDGFYMRVLPGNGQFNEFARLYSPVLPDTAVDCRLDFWYFCQTSSSTVEFKLEVKLADEAGYNIWTPDNSQGTSWMNVQLGLGRLETTYQLLFNGFVESDSDIIAIDAVSFSDCKVESYFPCEILCDNKLCVPYTAQCDYVNDCGDGTDENICSDYRMCDVESGTVCDWSQDSEDDLDWVWLNGFQGDIQGGPTDDHTYGTPSGHYFYLASEEEDANKRALLDGLVYSRPQNPGDCQLRFWAFMNGANVNRLSVLTKVSTHDDPVRAWTQTTPTGEMWIKYTVPLDAGYKFKVYFEGIAGGLDDNIALDDITMTPGCVRDPDQTLPDSVTPTDSPHCDVGERACRDGTCIASEKFCDFIYDCDDVSDEIDCPSVCDFEDDLCMWTQGVNDNFDWSRFNNTEDSSFSGPKSDHSRGSPMGIYYFVDGLTSSRNLHATLISPKFSQAGSDCVASVWYYIFGASYGNLEIKRRVLGVDRTLLAINEDNAITSQWTQASIPLPPCLANFNILIDAGNQQTTPASGGFAIDDIRFDNCAFDVSPSVVPCESNYYQCGAQHCYPRDSQCDLTKDCCTDSDNGNDEGSCASYQQCDFETDTCGIWSQIAEDDFDWSRVQGQDMSLLTFDHTLDSGEGYFMYMDPSNQASNGDLTQLGSYIIQPSNANCQMRFYYYMSGIDSGTLNVYTRTLVGGPLLSRWTDSGDRGLMWMKQVITLESDDIFQVIIEGVKGQSSSGVLAIDDTTFTPDCRVSSSNLPSSTTALPTTPTTTGVPTTKPKTEASTTKTPAEITTGKQATPENTEEPPEGNTALIIGLSVTFGLLFIIIIAASIFFWCRGRSSKEDLAALRGSMETTGYDKDFGNLNFALQEVDTSMFGEYPSDSMPSAVGIDNPMYSSPASLPIDDNTEA